MHKFDNFLVKTIFCCSLDTYLIMVMSDHFHFVYFEDQCELLSKFYQIYDFRLLHECFSES